MPVFAAGKRCFAVVFAREQARPGRSRKPWVDDSHGRIEVSAARKRNEVQRDARGYTTTICVVDTARFVA